MSSPTRHEVVAELPRLRRYARVLTGDADAVDDLVFDTLRRAWALGPLPAPPTSLAVQLFAVMRELHAARNRGLFADAHRSRSPLDGDLPAAAQSTTLPSEDSACVDALRHFDRLPADQREILALVAVERMSYAEIAALLGAPVASVMATLGRAREHLWSMSVASARAGSSSAGPITQPTADPRQAMP